MTKSNKNIWSYAAKITVTIIVIAIIYAFTLLYLKEKFILNNSNNTYKYSEYGNFVGGVLNPLFTLLSTSAIILLTYIIAKNESGKTDESILTQKRITLNEMRHTTLNNLIAKLNLFVYQLDKIVVQNVKTGTFVQKVLTNDIKKNDKEKVIVWFVILYELETFSQSSYLFEELFKDKEFLASYDSLKEITSKLSDEQASIRMVTTKNLESYINLQQIFVSKIGNYILQSFGNK